MALFRVVVLFVCIAVAGLFAASTEMTYEAYQVALVEAQTREKNAREQIAQEQSAIETLKQQLADVESRLSAVIQEMYAILGITDADIVDARNEIEAIRTGLTALQYVSGDELFSRQAELASLEARLASLKSKPVSRFWTIRDALVPVSNLAAQIRSNVPMSGSQTSVTMSGTTYSVVENPEHRDCLWRIAENAGVYGDPAQWTRLYRANKTDMDRIFDRYVKKNPNSKYTRPEDLLFPGQVLDIPR